MNSAIKKIAVSAMLASLTCLATLIKVPLPAAGYVNLGDAFVLLSGWLLPFPYGILAAGIGSGLADIFSGFAVYAPATFIIKGLMALVVFLGHKISPKHKKSLLFMMLGGVFAEVVMVAGYYVFEGFMYGFVTMLVNIPFNALQGAVGLVLGVLLVKLFDRVKLL